MSLIHSAYDSLNGLPSSNDGCVAVFGHIVPLFLNNLSDIQAKEVFAFKRQFRILHTISILKSSRVRLAQAKNISQISNLQLLDFLYSDIGKVYNEMTTGCLDDGLYPSRGFLDSLDGDELRSLAILIAFELINSLPSLPKYVLFAHDPHGLSDISIYCALRYLDITVYSFRWIPETSCSLIFRNIYDGYPDPMSLSSVDCLVANQTPITGFSQSWYQSVSAAVKSGAWSDVDNTVSAIGAKKFTPPVKNLSPSSSYSSKSISLTKSYSLRFKRFWSNASLIFSCQVVAKIKNRSYSLLQSIFERFARSVNLFQYSYDNYCISPKQCDIRSIDAIGDYVYVAWHLQPENTTSVFGLDNGNQLLFLRRVRALLDSSVTIVVKDHPLNYTELAYSRPKNYPEYLKALVPGVVFASLDRLSKDLIAGSICTFSVNGTACLEAALMGKPAVFGGLSFYSSLPNISNIQYFESQNAFYHWLSASSKIDSNDTRLKNFFIQREKFAHKCVPYGPISEQSYRGYADCFRSIENDLIAFRSNE